MAKIDFQRYKVRLEVLDKDILFLKQTKEEAEKKEWNEQSSCKTDKERLGVYRKYEPTIKKIEDCIRKLNKEREFCSFMSSEKRYVNQFLWSDINPYEVLEVMTENKIRVREMKCTLTSDSSKELKESFEPGGFVGHFDNSVQEWNIESDKDGESFILYRHKDGNFYLPNTRTCPFVPNTHPIKQYDYNF